MKKLLVTTICLLGAHLLSAGEIWISPQGNDLNDGTRPSPKATLTSALRQAHFAPVTIERVAVVRS